MIKGYDVTIEENPQRRIIRRETVKYLHSEIRNRYRIRNIENIPDIKDRCLLDGVDQKDIDRLEALFLGTVYPELEARQARDRSFDSLVKMLRNPAKLVNIIPTIPYIMFKYGTRFPRALRVGLNSVIAFTMSNRLENKMVENLEGIYRKKGTKIDESFKLKKEDYDSAFVMVPYGEARKMINLARVVIKAGSQTGMIETAWAILDEVEKTLDVKDRAFRGNGCGPEHWDDICAIEYGKSVLDNLRGAFQSYTRDRIFRMAEISWIVEINYLDRMYGKK